MMNCLSISAFLSPTYIYAVYGIILNVFSVFVEQIKTMICVSRLAKKMFKLFQNQIEFL